MKRRLVLLVDDDESLISMLNLHFGSAGYDTLVAYDGATALAHFFKYWPDIVVLDLMLPIVDGFIVLEKIRDSKSPIIVLSAKNSIETKVRALNMGADDYMTKPFDIEELLARIEMLLRRNSSTLVDESIVQQVGEFRIDSKTKSVFFRECDLQLTPKEYRLLVELMMHPGEVLSHGTLLQRVWGSDCQNERHYLHVYIERLRKKIESDPSNPCHVVARRGLGYCFLPGVLSESDQS